MEKYSLKTENEIEDILNDIQLYKNLFSINIEHFFDGWAISLEEKNMYPRKIIIFKSYKNNSYSIKSFEIQINNIGKESFHELYTKQGITSKPLLVRELKEIIYGKDLINFVSDKYYNKVLK